MKRNIFLLACLLLVWVGCKNDDYVWGEMSYARIVGPDIWTLGTDSMTYTFSTSSSDVTQFTVEAMIYVQGRVVDNDRSVRLKVDESRTSAVADSYTFPSEVVLKGGEHSTLCPIVINRTDEIKDKEYRLCVEIDPTGDLKAGVTKDASLTITWNDKISKPSNWEDDLNEFFGTYSEVKYRFIISTLGVSLFPYGEGDFTWGKMWNYHLQMIAALEKYNADETNPNRPLKDENGGIVSFN